MRFGSLKVCLLLPALAFAAPVVAQEIAAPAPEKDAFSGNYLVVGLGIASVPSYEGSDDRAVIGAGGVTGRIAGIGIGARSGGISLDFVPDGKDARIGFGLGPVVRWHGNRTAHIKDPVVEALGKLKGTIEAGVAASVTVKRVLTPVDTLTFSADLRWDATGYGGGRVVSTSVSYFTPVSEAAAFGLSVASDMIDTQYANYNYAVSPAGSTASGLPVFTAKGGIKSVGLRSFIGYDLDGNLRNGGLAIVGGFGWSRLYGSAAQNPLTRVRGRASQWLLGAGMAYTF
jgi:outer membrane scaffolding protein for murein synthesis (MipA/OmpV family)